MRRRRPVARSIEGLQWWDLARRRPTLTWRWPITAEARRLLESRQRTQHWKRWGPYLSERAWGTVREDYSVSGDAWEYFPHEHARSRVYRWNEDGLAGISDRHQKLCFALALWNGRDPILKERLFGVTGPQGNHGEDVKEYYFYLDSTPTHSYMKFAYKYPQAEFPYALLVWESGRRGKRDPEMELLDTGVFDGDRYFDVTVEYAKAGPEDILVQITATNRGPDPAEIHLLPSLWFRNTWSWDQTAPRPRLRATGTGGENGDSVALVQAEHPDYGTYELRCEGSPELLFTENETNVALLYGGSNASAHVKDGINDRVVRGNLDAVNPSLEGSKAAAWYRLALGPGETASVRLRLGKAREDQGFADFGDVFADRLSEADDFYAEVLGDDLGPEPRAVARQAFAGMLWSKQFYHYVVDRWLEGDPAMPHPPEQRKSGRNSHWRHLWNDDVISMPDKWEYPWYAAWDLAFHCVTLAQVDPDFAKDQLVLLLREWYMHPNGQLPAYEWALGDVNPPVHAWAALQVYEIERRQRGKGDRLFLERIFQKLMLNFTWWVNQKDTEGNNIFEGGFLGLDNIGVFDRSSALPTGGHLEQSDGSSWMAMYTLNLLEMALELAVENPAYEDVASKFLEHYIFIADAMNEIGNDGVSLWDEEDGFYYDMLHLPGGRDLYLKVRSMVGLIPLFAVNRLAPDVMDRFPQFGERFRWFLANKPALVENSGLVRQSDSGPERLLSLVSPVRLRRILRFMLDETEFLSGFGIRSLSQIHREQPYRLVVDGHEYRVDYDPAESTTGMFGGNSNWRGPIWFPVNYLLIESLRKFHEFLGDDFLVECPTGSGVHMTLAEAAAELSRRLCSIFLPGPDARRPVYGGTSKFQEDPLWRDKVLFFEYFHGDDGAGLGASHQTGWTGLVANLLTSGADRRSARSAAPVVANVLRR